MKAHRYMTPVERLFANLRVTESCILWAGTIDGNGYGRIRWNGRSCYAHRVMWQFLNGQIQAGKDLDHLCRVHHCVNVAHLEVVTRQVNLLRGVGFPAVNASKTHCPQGHPYTGCNLVLRVDGHRQCRACIDARKREKNRVQRQRYAVAMGRALMDG